MRKLWIALLVAVLMPGAAVADMADDCVQVDDYQLKAMGCTRAIESGKWSGKNLAWAYNNRGNAYINLKDYRAAVRDLDRALELDPAHENALYNLGIAYSRQGDYRTAERNYGRVIRLKRDYWQAYQNRAYVREKLGELSMALADINEVLRYKSGHLPAMQARANILCKRGDVESSVLDRLEVIRRGHWKADSAQRWLTKQGYDTKGADGKFGQSSKAALRRWTRDGCPGI